MTKTMTRKGASKQAIGPSWDVWLAPTTIYLEQGNLVCPVEQDWRRQSGGAELFREFVLLADAPDVAIRDFALKWGALILCRDHRMPIGHDRTPSVLPTGSRGCPAAQSDDAYWTRLDEWRWYSTVAGAVERLAAALRYDKLGADEDWNIVRTAHGFALQSLLDASAQAGLTENRRLWGRREVAHVVELWLQLGGVEPHLQWEDEAPRIVLGSGQFGGAGFFGGLALQLMLAVSETRELTVCSFCGRPYVPTKRPNPNRNHYCPDCGPSRAASEASARYRERRKTKEQSERRRDARARGGTHGQAQQGKR